MKLDFDSYPIFVPTVDVDEKTTDYYELVNWGMNHLAHPNVFIIKKNDLYTLQIENGILDIVNEENCSMIGEGEDDIITSQEAKLNILIRLRNYKALNSDREKELLDNILRLLEIAIETDKGLYFRF